MNRYSEETGRKVHFIPPAGDDWMIQILADDEPIGSISVDQKQGTFLGQSTLKKSSGSVYLRFDPQTKSISAYHRFASEKLKAAAIARVLLRPIFFEDLIEDPMLNRGGFPKD